MRLKHGRVHDAVDDSGDNLDTVHGLEVATAGVAEADPSLVTIRHHYAVHREMIVELHAIPGPDQVAGAVWRPLHVQLLERLRSGVVAHGISEVLITRTPPSGREARRTHRSGNADREDRNTTNRLRQPDESTVVAEPTRCRVVVRVLEDLRDRNDSSARVPLHGADPSLVGDVRRAVRSRQHPLGVDQGAATFVVNDTVLDALK